VSNDDVYASGLLTRALDPATQPVEIRTFMQTEIDLLRSLVGAMTWLDVGCGTGRHLAMLSGSVRFGVGLDYEHAYVAQARRQCSARRLHFITGDATRLPVSATFDLATCMTNTWGTMSDKPAVLREMRRCARRRILSVFSLESIPARREWYRSFGHPVVEETDECLVTEGGLRSEHFTEARLRALVGSADVRRCAGIGYVVDF
jgi:SAM-dependent methyltransferase